MFSARRLSSPCVVEPIRACLFPGQGSQHVGMGRDLYEQFSCARLIFDEVDQTLKQKLSALMFNGPPDELTLTENAQPAILAVSAALLQVYKETTGEKVTDSCKFLLGHSLGEYSALLAAESISLSEAVKLVRQRGLAMRDAKAAIQQPTSMIALIIKPHQLAKIESALSYIRSNLLDVSAVVDLANINSSSQVVLSGDRHSVQVACRELEAQHIAARAVELPVSAPFHCRLMIPAAITMQQTLSTVHFKPPLINVISNYTAQPIDNVDTIKELLVKQIVESVQWHKSIQYCCTQDVTEFLVFGPARVMGTLLKKECLPDTHVYVLVIIHFTRDYTSLRSSVDDVM